MKILSFRNFWIVFFRRISIFAPPLVLYRDLLYYYQNCYAATEKVKVEAPRAVEENFAAIASYEASPPAIESSRPLLYNAPPLAS